MELLVIEKEGADNGMQIEGITENLSVQKILDTFVTMIARTKVRVMEILGLPTIMSMNIDQL